MFTKPVNFPQFENKSKQKKTWFNGYVLCFLFMILCVLLVLAYRIEVKIIQQNLKNNYDTYIHDLKKGLADEENFIILKNNYDVKENGQDYEIIEENIDPDLDYNNKFSTSVSGNKPSSAVQDSGKPSSTASVIPSGNSGKETPSTASTQQSEQTTTSLDSAKTTEGSKVEITSRISGHFEKLNISEESSEEDISTSSGTGSTEKAMTGSKILDALSKSTTGPMPSPKSASEVTKAVPVDVYITQSIKVHDRAPTKNNSKDPSNIVFDEDTAGNTTTGEESYNLPNVDTMMQEDSSEEDEYGITKKDSAKLSTRWHPTNPPTLSDSSEEISDESDSQLADADKARKRPSTSWHPTNPPTLSDSSEEIDESDSPLTDVEKKIIQDFNNRKNGKDVELHLDPPNENVDLFKSNMDEMSNMMDKIHKHISQSISNMDKSMAPLNIDIRDLDPFYRRDKVQNTPLKNSGDKGHLLILGPVLA